MASIHVRLLFLKTKDKSLKMLLTEVTGDLDLVRDLHKSSQTTQFNINNNFAKPWFQSLNPGSI